MQSAYALMLCSKFLFLGHLSIALIGAPFYPTYNYLSLSSFFFYDAPSLETFNLNVSCHSYYYDISIYGGNMA